VVFSFARSIAVTAQVTEAAGMAFREVSVNEIREVLRVWLGVAGLPAPGYRRIAAHCGIDRKTVRYAEFGITDLMPYRSLCRIGVLAVRPNR
jgi:hypothetical protein